MPPRPVAEFHAGPGRGDDVEGLLLEILGESLEFEGCEAIRIARDQDDADHVAGTVVCPAPFCAGAGCRS